MSSYILEPPSRNGHCSVGFIFEWLIKAFSTIREPSNQFLTALKMQRLRCFLEGSN